VRKGALKAEEVVLAGVAFLRRCARGKKLKVNSKAVRRTRTLQLRGRRPAGRGESSGYGHVQYPNIQGESRTCGWQSVRSCRAARGGHITGHFRLGPTDPRLLNPRRHDMKSQ
jgi:hypothetical protein